MAKHVFDLSPEELESHAREAWGGAAREALSKGLSVTGSLKGHRYRYDPKGTVKDLGPVETPRVSPAPREKADPLAAVAVYPEPFPFKIPVFELAKVGHIQLEERATPEAPSYEMPVVEMPLAFREFAERGVVQAREVYVQTKAAALEATYVLTTTPDSAIAKGASEYGLKVIELAQSNTNSVFEFANELFEAKTLTEVIKLSNEHIRRQFEQLTLQSKELAALAERVVIEASHEVARQNKKRRGRGAKHQHSPT
jgi:hypothetical protein